MSRFREARLDRTAATLSLSSDHLDPRDRGSILHEIFARGYMNLDIEFLGAQPELCVYLWELPGIAITSGEPIARARSRSFDVSRGNGSIVLARGHGPVALARCRGDEIDYGGRYGTSTLLPDWEHSAVETGDGFKVQTVGFQRETLLPVLPDLEDRVLARVPGEHPALRILDAYLPLACTTEVLRDPAKASEASENLRDVVAVAFGTRRSLRRDALRRGYSNARRVVMMDWVRKRAADPALSVQSAAAEMKVSERTLQEVFHCASTTFSDFVVEERLELAWEALTDPCQAQRSILSIALDAGFSDISYFNRRFRGRYGCTPSEARAGEFVEQRRANFAPESKTLAATPA
jgi:AraC-like DNA-binding protein